MIVLSGLWLLATRWSECMFSTQKNSPFLHTATEVKRSLKNYSKKSDPFGQEIWPLWQWHRVPCELSHIARQHTHLTSWPTMPMVWLIIHGPASPWGSVSLKHLSQSSVTHVPSRYPPWLQWPTQSPLISPIQNQCGINVDQISASKQMLLISWYVLHYIIFCICYMESLPHIFTEVRVENGLLAVFSPQTCSRIGAIVLLSRVVCIGFLV